MTLMSIMNKKNWYRLDNETEEFIRKDIRFIRPVNHETVSIDCPCCKVLISTIEDVESVKKYDVCEECQIIYYYPNKEKWENGWRPYK